MSFPSLFNFHLPSCTVTHFGNYVNVYWYERVFSQSLYPPGQKESSACTLICLFVAQGIAQQRLLIFDMKKCPKLVAIIAESMKNGNSIHAQFMKDGLISNPFLNTVEALTLGGRNLNLLKEWKFEVFHEDIRKGLYQNITKFLSLWNAAPKSRCLFMLLISCGRTVLFIFQEPTSMITFFDSHSHGKAENPNRGLVIAQAAADKLDQLCDWYIEEINNLYIVKASQYELAFLYPHCLHCCP